LFLIGKMIEPDKKKEQEADFTQKHTMTPQDFKKMIAEKMERAKWYSQAVRKREGVLDNR
jgi:hypothetical protein